MNRPAGGQTNYHFENNARITDRIEIVGVNKGIPVSFAIGENQVSVFSTLADPEKLLINVGTRSQISVISDTIKKGVILRLDLTLAENIFWWRCFVRW